MAITCLWKAASNLRQTCAVYIQQGAVLKLWMGLQDSCASLGQAETWIHHQHWLPGWPACIQGQCSVCCQQVGNDGLEPVFLFGRAHSFAALASCWLHVRADLRHMFPVDSHIKTQILHLSLDSVSDYAALCRSCGNMTSGYVHFCDRLKGDVWM